MAFNASGTVTVVLDSVIATTLEAYSVSVLGAETTGTVRPAVTLALAVDDEVLFTWPFTVALPLIVTGPVNVGTVSVDAVRLPVASILATMPELDDHVCSGTI